jgi:hypothetical protein
MPQLRSIVYGLVETTRRELRRDLLLLDIDNKGNAIEGLAQVLAIN